MRIDCVWKLSNFLVNANKGCTSVKLILLHRRLLSLDLAFVIANVEPWRIRVVLIAQSLRVVIVCLACVIVDDLDCFAFLFSLLLGCLDFLTFLADEFFFDEFFSLFLEYWGWYLLVVEKTDWIVFNFTCFSSSADFWSTTSEQTSIKSLTFLPKTVACSLLSSFTLFFSRLTRELRKRAFLDLAVIVSKLNFTFLQPTLVVVSFRTWMKTSKMWRRLNRLTDSRSREETEKRRQEKLQEKW